MPLIQSNRQALFDESTRPVVVLGEHARLGVEQVGAVAPARQIAGLDILRFFASLLVVLFHLAFWNRVSPNPLSHNYDYVWLTPISYFGWIGVQIFFVMSGFVIAYSANHATASDFLRRRALRLYPAVWVCASVSLIVLLLGTGWHRYLIHAWMNSLVLWPLGTLIDPSYWTLGIEISFYLVVFSLLLFRLFRFIGPLILLIACVNIVSLLLVFAVRRGYVDDRFAIIYADFVQSRWGQLCLLQHGSLFCMGVFLWLFLLEKKTVARMAALTLSTFGSVLTIQFDRERIDSVSGIHLSSLPIYAFWITGMLALIFSVSYNDAASKWIGPRGLAVTRMLGLITYPFYLVHQEVGNIIIYKLHGRLPDGFSLSLAICATISVAYGSVVYSERPLQRWIKGLFALNAKR